MSQRKNHHKDTYRIRLKDGLNRSIADWLGDVSILPQENGETVVIAKFADQAALRGFLDQLWNLNCTVLSIERIENGNHSPA